MIFANFFKFFPTWLPATKNFIKNSRLISCVTHHGVFPHFISPEHFHPHVDIANAFENNNARGLLAKSLTAMMSHVIKKSSQRRCDCTPRDFLYFSHFLSGFVAAYFQFIAMTRHIHWVLREGFTWCFLHILLLESERDVEKRGRKQGVATMDNVRNNSMLFIF